MIDRNRDLTAFQARALDACGKEFATIPAFAAAVGLGRDQTYRLCAGLRKIGDRYSVADMAERVFEALHPRPKRA